MLSMSETFPEKMISKLKFKAFLIYSKIAVHNYVSYLPFGPWKTSANQHIHKYHTMTVNVYNNNPR